MAASRAVPTQQRSGNNLMDDRLSVTPRGSLWIWVAFCSALSLMALHTEAVQGDAWWDFTIGRWELAHHSLATINLWGSHGIGQRWVNPEWAWSLLLAFAAHGGQAAWFGILVIGVVGYCAGLAALMESWQVHPSLRVILLMSSLLMAQGAWVWTPIVWAIPCAVWGLWLITRLRQVHAPSPAWRLALGGLGLGVAWAAWHPSWILLVVWGVIEGALLPSWRRQLWWGLGLLVMLGLIALSQPWGASYLVQPLLGMRDPWVAIVSPEWTSPIRHHLALSLIFVVYGITGAWALAVGWKHTGWSREWLRRSIYWLGFGLAGMYAVRFLPYLPLGCIAAWSTWTPSRSMAWLPPKVSAGATAIGAAGFILGLITVWPHGPITQHVSTQDPVGITRVLADHGYGQGTPVFNSLALGGYLEFVGLRPWIDGREDFWVTQGNTLAAYARAATGRISRVRVVEHTGLRLAVVTRTSKWAWSLESARWTPVWHTSQTVLLVAPGTAWPRSGASTVRGIPKIWRI